MSETLARVLPRFPEPDTEPFWEMARQHRLGYQVCVRCGGLVFYPRQHCTHCTSTELEWRQSSGRGIIYTYTVMRQHGHPAFAAMLPYVLAFVDIEEGFRLLTQIVDADPAEIRIGQRVQVQWLEQGSVMLPAFTRMVGDIDEDGRSV